MLKYNDNAILIFKFVQLPLDNFPLVEIWGN